MGSNIGALVHAYEKAVAGGFSGDMEAWLEQLQVVANGPSSAGLLLAYPVFDTFDRADGSIGSADSGQAWTVRTGTWVIATNWARCTSASGRITIPAGLANLHAQMIVKSPAAAASQQLIARYIDDNNRLFVNLGYASATSVTVTIQKADAGAFSTLATGSAVTITSGADLRVGFSLLGDALTARLEVSGGALLSTVTHTLSSADQTKFGGQTIVGVTDATNGAGRIDNFLIRSAL